MPVAPRSARYAAFGALMIGAAITSLSPSAHADESVAAEKPAICHKFAVKDTFHADSKGRRISQSTPNSDTVREFGTNKGSMKVTVPPNGFDPRTASASELRKYGFPPRPTQPAALQKWKEMYPKSGIEYIVPDMCTSDFYMTHAPHFVDKNMPAASPYAGLPPSDNWSGGVAQQATGNPSFTFADVKWTEPTFSASCPTTSAYSIWSGLGGYKSPLKLLQAGVSNLKGTGTNGDYAWWEALNDNRAMSLGEHRITNFPASAEDQIQAVTYYSRPDATVSFQLYNLTRNKLLTLGPWHVLVDFDGTVLGTADQFYDGSTAELIVERPSHNGTTVNLRHPTSGYSQFLDSALGNSDEGVPYPGYQFPNWRRLNMHAVKTGDVLSEPSGFPTKPGDNGWKNYWYNCS